MDNEKELSTTKWIQEFYPVRKGGHVLRTHHNQKDIYNHYAKKYPVKMDNITFNKLCSDFNMRLANTIITQSFEFKMPFRLGSIRIRAEKLKLKFTPDGKVDTIKMPINWGATRKLWKELWPDKTMDEIKQIPNKKLIVYVNDHSNGYVMRWYWDKNFAKIKNNRAYIFKPVKGRQEPEYYKEDGAFYYGRRGLNFWIKNDERINEYYE